MNWWIKFPALLDDARAALAAPYDTLSLSIDAALVRVSGAFPVVHDDDVLDSYGIEVSFPAGYPHELPIVRETAGRVPAEQDRHNSTGRACLYVPFEWKLMRPDKTFRTFLDGPVRSYFLGQSLLEAGVDPKLAWPAGERRHGFDGIKDAIREHLRLTEDVQVRRVIVMLMQNTIRDYWGCPCGSGRRLRKCHGRAIRRIHDRGTAKWLRDLTLVDDETRRSLTADICRSPARQRRHR